MVQAFSHLDHLWFNYLMAEKHVRYNWAKPLLLSFQPKRYLTRITKVTLPVEIGAYTLLAEVLLKVS